MRQRGIGRIALFILFAAVPAPGAEASNYAKAEALVRQGQWDQGIALLEPLIRAEPLNPKVHNLLGIALTGKGETARANEQFRQALKIDSRFYPALKNLAVNEFTLHQIRAAERDLAAALELAPNDPIIHTYLAEIAFGRSDYAGAARHYERVGPMILRDPQLTLHLAESWLETGEKARALELLQRLDANRLDARSQFSAGYMLARQNLFGQAAPYFEAVSARYPDSYDAGYNLALCYVEMKHYPEAIGVLSRLRANGHKTSEVDNLLAEAFEGNHQTQQALDTLREATLLAPEEENNYLDLATLCIDHSAYPLGLEVANVGLHYKPESARLIFQRGVLHALMDQFEDAEKDFELSSRLAPEKDLAYVGLGLTYMQKSNLPKAIEVVRKRIKAKPNDYVLQYLLGEALIRSGVNPGDIQFGEARAALEKSIALNPTFARSQIDLAKLDLKTNRVDEAIRHLEEARALDPQEKAVYSHLAAAYRRKGQPEKTAAMLAIVKKLNDEERVRSYRDLVRIVSEDSVPAGESERQPGPIPPH